MVCVYFFDDTMTLRLAAVVCRQPGSGTKWMGQGPDPWILQLTSCTSARTMAHDCWQLPKYVLSGCHTLVSSYLPRSELSDLQAGGKLYFRFRLLELKSGNRLENFHLLELKSGNRLENCTI